MANGIALTPDPSPRGRGRAEDAFVDTRELVDTRVRGRDGQFPQVTVRSLCRWREVRALHGTWKRVLTASDLRE
jgi:hypothetical protein